MASDYDAIRDNLAGSFLNMFHQIINSDQVFLVQRDTNTD